MGLGGGGRGIVKANAVKESWTSVRVGGCRVGRGGAQASRRVWACHWSGHEEEDGLHLAAIAGRDGCTADMASNMKSAGQPGSYLAGKLGVGAGDRTSVQQRPAP